MAIKDKNGNVYKLRCPNPLLLKQDVWDKNKTSLINLSWKPEIIIDKYNPVKIAQENIVDIAEELELHKNNVTKPVPTQEFMNEIVQPIVEDSVVVINADKKLKNILKERGVAYYCAPAIGYETHIDELYGNNYKTTNYGEKYVFDAVVIESSDLQIQFWCVRPITNDSIIYQVVKEGNLERRWWRVDEVELKTGGYLVIGSVSDLNPDFS